MIVDRLHRIIEEPLKAKASAVLGVLYLHLSEEEREIVDLDLADPQMYSPHETAQKLLDRIEEARMRAAGVSVTKAQREVLTVAWERGGDYPFDDETPVVLLEAALGLYNQGLLLRAESIDGRRYRLTPEGREVARVLCAP
jgi:hypothetical protein